MSKIKLLIEKYQLILKLQTDMKGKTSTKDVCQRKVHDENIIIIQGIISDLKSLSQPTINEGYDLKTLEHVKLIFDIQSDMSSSTHGYHILCDLIDKIKSNPQLSQPNGMTSERIREIQEETAYPNSVSVQQALLKVWNECTQVNQPVSEVSDQEIESEAENHFTKTADFNMSDRKRWFGRMAFIRGAKWLREKGNK